MCRCRFRLDRSPIKMNPELYAQLRHTVTHGQSHTAADSAVRTQLLCLAPRYFIDNQILFYTPPNVLLQTHIHSHIHHYQPSLLFTRIHYCSPTTLLLQPHYTTILIAHAAPSLPPHYNQLLTGSRHPLIAARSHISHRTSSNRPTTPYSRFRLA
jgi:hypothetical protein